MTPPLLPFDPIAATPTVRRSLASPSALVTTIALHPHQTIAHEQTMEVLTSPADHPFVLVVGPGGVGKTSLIALLDNALHYEARADMAADPSLRPAIVVDAPTASTAQYDFVELWVRIIAAAERPPDGVVGHSVLALGKAAAISGARGDRPKDLFRLAVQACRNRGVRTILLDEANHVSVLAGSARAPEQLDKLKDFAKAADVRILLVGAFPVLAVRDISFQVARRIRTVPFLSYDASVKRELAAFRSAASQLLEVMDGLQVSLDDDLVDYLHEGSAGCVGNLRNWLVAAEHHVRRRSRAGNLRAVLAATRLPASSLRQARDEISLGREILAGERRAAPERPYTPPRTASGQLLKPGEAIPVRLEMPELSRA